ncbi:CoA ester lyase [Dasania sp. GY-MA-18]|uniref:CoA ester lyase n=1 Tax=Dasania phycosphaerae TaxID=2950436 RepID=A0A9J6RHR6_9GAMM|nr:MULTISPECIES: CoA ester lyase [Dasania]MCR8921453.1 CoA ester lyase [Dasania sp. GY-MA-18]MCZ0863881.1 CoA ester lyase [Dasania phycosphaerae]MCZ0867609.1 CoA ester lyase [Dasania phycosphaerae]
MQIRPRRSVLYMPGSNPRALAKAQQLAADCLIFDMEDAVAPAAKAQAREIIKTAIQQGDYGRREIVVRVNALDTEWGEADLKAMAHSGAHAICLPKVESAAEVAEALAILDRAQAPASLYLWVMAETPRGVLNIEEVCSASERVTVLMMGTSDLSKELRLRNRDDRQGLLASLNLCVLAARANNLDIIDGVQLDLNNEQAYQHSCEQGRDLGFDGKSVIHPKQLAYANQMFAPSATDVEWAHKVIAAWQQAEQAGEALVLLDGRLIENLHVEEARRTLSIAAAIEH